MAKIPMKDWKWFGTPGHHCCSDPKFHLATQVGKYLISSVGAFYYETGGIGRYEKANIDTDYETMVFDIVRDGCVRGCDCGMLLVDWGAVEGTRTNTPGECQKSHMALCEKYSKASLQK